MTMNPNHIFAMGVPWRSRWYQGGVRSWSRGRIPNRIALHRANVVEVVVRASRLASRGCRLCVFPFLSSLGGVGVFASLSAIRHLRRRAPFNGRRAWLDFGWSVSGG